MYANVLSKLLTRFTRTYSIAPSFFLKMRRTPGIMFESKPFQKYYKSVFLKFVIRLERAHYRDSFNFS